MIEGIGNHLGMGFGLHSCPHCGRSGLSGTTAPCPSCGGTVDTASRLPGHPTLPGMPASPPSHAVNRGDDAFTRSAPPSLQEQLREEQEERSQPEPSSRDHTPRSAAAALEGAMQGEAGAGPREEEPGSMAAKAAAAAAGISSASADAMDSAKLEQLRQLQERDREVRAHEQAHISAGGSVVTGGASYTYETGPDGRQYAVGGEVGIDTSPVPNNPEATMEKAQTIRRAALAPASPSGQDQKVAAQAARMEAEARLEKAEEGRSGNQSQTDTPEQGLAGAAGAQSPEVHAALQSGGAPVDENAAVASLMPPADSRPVNLGIAPHKTVHEAYGRQNATHVEQDEARHRVHFMA
jgi:hypothetical protein